MKNFDKQLSEFKIQLEFNVKIPPNKVGRVASTIALEIKQKKEKLIQKLSSVSPVPLKIRLEELSAFQTMMDTFNKMNPRPEIVRSQIITQNYISFVYLKDTLFEVLRKNSEIGTVTKKCTKFLLNNPVRAFRNSIAHGNWKYLDDFSGIEYWAHKEGKLNEPMTRYEVSQLDLDFWQTLSRAVAYTSFLILSELN